jgi:hypothetical protein
MVPKQIYEFTDSRQAEVLARCCRVWVDPALDTLDPDSVALAEAVLKVRQCNIGCGLNPVRLKHNYSEPEILK